MKKVKLFSTILLCLALVLTLFSSFSFADEKQEMKTHTLKNENFELTVMEFGAIVNSLKFKGQETVLRCDSEQEYVDAGAYYSAIIGRYANRIAKSAFTLDGKEYKLVPNEGENQVHSGPNSIDKRYWTVECADDEKISLSILSPDGDNGFPGNLKITVTYSLTENGLRVVFEGETDAPTVYAPTFHPYFAYSSTPSICINAKQHLEVGSDLIPTGKLLDCEGKFDFSEMREIDTSLDDAFVLTDEHALTLKTDSYTMEVWTDFPAVQVYSGNPAGVAIEAEAFPDSPNHPNFPDTTLRPGEKFCKWVEYRFF